MGDARESVLHALVDAQSRKNLPSQHSLQQTRRHGEYGNENDKHENRGRRDRGFVDLKELEVHEVLNKLDYV